MSGLQEDANPQGPEASHRDDARLKLIEEAAKAIWIARHADGDLKWGEMAWSELTMPDNWDEEALEALEQARAAWAVFEAAHAEPSDAPDLDKLAQLATAATPGPWVPVEQGERS